MALAIEPPTFPWTPRLARFQAVSSNRVTNLWHRSVTVSDLQRHLLQWLDGNHDRAALVEQLNRRVNDGSLIVHEQGTAVGDSQRVRELLNDILENNLVQLGAKGLLQIQTDG